MSGNIVGNGIKELFIFNCPIHHVEIGAICWRALDPAYSGCWQKVRIDITPLEASVDEIADNITSLTEWAMPENAQVFYAPSFEADLRRGRITL